MFYHWFYHVLRVAYIGLLRFTLCVHRVLLQATCSFHLVLACCVPFQADRIRVAVHRAASRPGAQEWPLEALFDRVKSI